MRRRTLLAGFTGLAAGCIGDLPATSNGTNGTTEANGTNGNGTGGLGDGYRVTNLSVETGTEAPGVRYVLRPDTFYDADGVESKREEKDVRVVDIEEVEGEAARAAIREAASSEWRSNTLPDGLADLVERVDFFTGVSDDEPYTHVGFTLYEFDLDAPPAITFDATLTDHTASTGSPAAIEFSIANESDETQRVFSGTVSPFGVVHAERTDGDGRVLLWREYEEEGCVGISEGSIHVCAVAVAMPIEPGETVARRYELLPPGTETHPEHTVPPGRGTYRIDSRVGYVARRGAPITTLTVRVTFDLG